MSLWPIGVGSAVVSAWLAWDVSLAGLVLPARELGEFAVAATIGKVPFHLSSLLVSRGVLESAWGSGSVRRLRRLIAGLGLAVVLGAATVGGAVLHAFGVPMSPPYLLGGYAAAATLLALLSFELGRSGAAGRHVWPAAAASLGLWTLAVATLRPGVAELLALLLAALVMALGAVLTASRRRGPPWDMAGTVTDAPVDIRRA